MAITIMVEDIPVEVIKKRIKNMYLYVRSPDGKVTVSVPLKASTTDINKFVYPRIDWIRRHRESFTSRKIPMERKWDEGETVLVAGVEYPIHITYAATQYAKISDGKIVLGMRNGHSPESRHRIIREFLRSDLQMRIEEALPYWQNLTGLSCSSWAIKDMKTRWGSCNTGTKMLWFNLKLGNMPDRYLDYILLHEIAHLAVAGHGAAFNAILDKFMPDWRARKKELNSRYVDFL